jgi:hypothetical protein
MRDLLSKRLKRRREKSHTVFDNYLLDYIDVFMAITITLVFRLVILKTIVAYCEWDYVSYWTDWHEQYPPPLYMFLGCLLLSVFWSVHSLTFKSYSSKAAQTISYIVRVLTLIITLSYSLLLVLLVTGNYEWGRYEDYGYIANTRPNMELPLRNWDIEQFKETDPEYYNYWKEYQRCPKHFELREFYRHRTKYNK